MIATRVRTRSEIPKVLRKARRANIQNLGHGAATIRLVAKRSIRRRKGASKEGQPPHTHSGRFPKGIIYAVEAARQRALIGFSRRIVGPAGALHEHGKARGGIQFPARPTMAPALEKTKDRLPKHWGGSIG